MPATVARVAAVGIAPTAAIAIPAPAPIPRDYLAVSRNELRPEFPYRRELRDASGRPSRRRYAGRLTTGKPATAAPVTVSTPLPIDDARRIDELIKLAFG